MKTVFKHYSLSLLSFIVIWGLFIYSVVYHGFSIIFNIVIIIVGIALFAFAQRISSWLNHDATKSHERTSNKPAVTLLDAVIRKITNMWAFRLSGLCLILMSVYHLYDEFQGIDNKAATGIMLNCLAVYCFIWGWLEAKGAPYRIIVLKCGISWAITVVTYVLSMRFHFVVLFLVTFIAFVAMVTYLVKWWIAKRKYLREQY